MARPRKPKNESAREIISEKNLKALAENVDLLQTRAANATGLIGAAITEAVKKHNLNAAAFRVIQRIRRLCKRDPVKGRVFLDDFDAMRDQLNLDDEAAAQLLLEGGNAPVEAPVAATAETPAAAQPAEAPLA